MHCSRIIYLYGWIVAAVLAVPVAAQDTLLGELYGRGVHAYFSSEYETSHQFLTQAIEQGSKDPRCHYFRGLACLRLGRPEDATLDFKSGGDLEAATPDTYPVGRSLERVQGDSRIELESHRHLARVEARTLKIKREKERYEQLEAAEDRVLRPPVGGKSEVEVNVPEPAEGDGPNEDNLVGDDASDVPLGAGKVERAPPKSQAGDDEFGGDAEPFGDEPGADDDMPADDPFGADVDDAEPAGADDAGPADDPFGADADDAEPADADDAGPADDPFGADADDAEPADDPFGAAEPEDQANMTKKRRGGVLGSLFRAVGAGIAAGNADISGVVPATAEEPLDEEIPADGPGEDLFGEEDDGPAGGLFGDEAPAEDDEATDPFSNEESEDPADDPFGTG